MIRLRRFAASTLAILFAAPLALYAQPPATPKLETHAPVASPAYTYQVEGRRDPFVSLIGRGTDPETTVSRPAGLPGVLIGEVAVKGIMKDRGVFMAMLQGPDKRTYWVRAGEKLFDGSVKTVTADSIVFAQDVNDQLSAVKQREIVKKLRPTEGGRE